MAQNNTDTRSGPITRAMTKMGVNVTTNTTVQNTRNQSHADTPTTTPDTLIYENIIKYSVLNKNLHDAWLANPNRHDLSSMPHVTPAVIYNLVKMSIKSPTDLLARFLSLNCDLGLFYHSIKHCFNDAHECEAVTRIVAEWAYKLLKT